MAIGRGHILVRAMLVILDDTGTRHAVSLMPPTVENPRGYHRFVGGSVNLGETTEAAVRREVREELAAEVELLHYLGAVESIFRIHGELGHEVAFVYAGRIDPPVPREGGELVENDGERLPVMWRDLRRDAGDRDAGDPAERGAGDGGEADGLPGEVRTVLPLYPEAVLPLLRGAARAHGQKGGGSWSG